MDTVRGFEFLKERGGKVEASGWSGSGKTIFSVDGLIKTGVGDHFFDVGRGWSLAKLVESLIELIVREGKLDLS